MQEGLLNMKDIYNGINNTEILRSGYKITSNMLTRKTIEKVYMGSGYVNNVYRSYQYSSKLSLGIVFYMMVAQ